jgi:uncharacterized membrane protein
MGDFACLGVFFAVAAFLCGPIALIVSIVSANRIRALEEQLHRQPIRTGIEPLQPVQPEPLKAPPLVEEQEFTQEEEKSSPSVPWIPVQLAAEPAEPPLHEEAAAASQPAPALPSPQQRDAPAEFAEKIKKELAAQKLSLEVFLGTRGLAIAGSIAVLVGVIIGLKYLYDMKLITPLGRTLIVAGGGIVALVIGQVTRKRGYEIVATALAALGFAMLYAADFAAFAFYHIIGTNLAFGLAIAITAAGMLYAVRLNEIIVAFISLLGGFLSPVVLSSGENRPNTLFSYLLILIGGAMACAAVRKWRSVSRLSFIGTAVLYAAWFHKWYSTTPDQLPVAVTWMSIFFAIYLVMPVLYELLKREVAHKGDVLLILTNATFCYIYLHQILFSHYRPYLALAAICLGAAHLGLMGIVHRRSPDDKALKLSLLVLGLFFVTVAIPLYLKMYAVALAWTGEGIVLTFIALRYRSQITQLASFAAMALAVFALIRQLPLHDAKFVFIFNHAFGSWCFVAAAYYVVHLFYRRAKEYALAFTGEAFAQIFYCLSLALLLTAACLEWHGYTSFNLAVADSTMYGRGLLVIIAAFTGIYLLPRLRPRGVLAYVVSCALAIAALVSTIVYSGDFYKGPFALVVNTSFGSVAFVAVMYYVAHWFYRRPNEQLPPFSARILAQIFYCGGLAILLLAACMDWHGHTKYNLASVDHAMFYKGLLVLLSAFMVFYLIPRLRPQGVLAYVISLVLAMAAFVLTLTLISDFYKGPFAFVVNSSFGSVVFVAAAYYVAHLMNRHVKIRLTSDESGYFAQILFCMSLIVLFTVMLMEWYGQTRYNLIPSADNLYTKWFIKGAVVICSAFVILFLLPVFRPSGVLPVMAATTVATVTSIGTLVVFPDFYVEQFMIFANAPFIIGLAPMAALAVAAILLYRERAFLKAAKYLVFSFGLGIIFFLWILLTEEIYLYWNYPGHMTLAAGIDKGQMWISITWAVYAAAVIAVGLWRKLITLRYIGLCFFTIVLIKVFIFDMSTLEKIYRIAGFIVLGLVLIGVSYLYQYLRKTGFFEKSSAFTEST